MTGGTGFIGSHVVDRLLEEGYEVTAVNNLSEGLLENLTHLKREEVQVRKGGAGGQLTDQEAWHTLISKEHS